MPTHVFWIRYGFVPWARCAVLCALMTLHIFVQFTPHNDENRAFYKHGYAVINPETCTVERKVNDEVNLPSSWSDGIYMEYHDHDHDHDHRGRRLEHPGHGNGYILINSRDNSEPDETTGASTSEILVFNTDKDMTGNDALVSRIETGSRMVHSYGVYTRNEASNYWRNIIFGCSKNNSILVTPADRSFCICCFFIDHMLYE